jgi:hypothetical protein
VQLDQAFDQRQAEAGARSPYAALDPFEDAGLIRGWIPTPVSATVSSNASSARGGHSRTAWPTGTF